MLKLLGVDLVKKKKKKVASELKWKTLGDIFDTGQISSVIAVLL